MINEPDDELYPLTCPKCGCYYADEETYCIRCGNILPLPPTLKRLSRKASDQSEEICTHDLDRKFRIENPYMDMFFCAKCGEKL